MKRILCLMLVLVMLVPLFTACGSGDKVTLFGNDTCEIAYEPNSALLANVQRLGKAISEATGLEVKITPTVNENTEIFVGLVDHDDARAATSDLRVNDYIAGVFGEHYVIASPTAATTNRAISYFIEEVLPLADGKLKLRSRDNFRLDGIYAINNVKIGGLTLDRHSIVIPAEYSINELRTAYNLQVLLKSVAGYDLPIVTPDHVQTTGQIRIGASICEKAKATAEHSYTIAGNGTALEIVASSYLGYEGLQKALREQIFVTGAAVLLDDTTNIKGNNRGGATAPLAAKGDVRIMLNNMYGGHEAIYPNPQRMEMLTELYFTYMPDVLGLQEMNPNNGSGDLLDRLISTYYTEAGKLTGTELATRKNYTPLYYNADRLEIVKNGEGEEYTGNFRFNLDLNYNDYPELNGNYPNADLQKRAGDVSKGFNWAIFRVKGSDYVFMAASVHLWFKHDDAKDASARTVQIQAMKEELSKQAATFAAEMGLNAATIPIFVGGDYNCNASNELPQMSAETNLDTTIGGNAVNLNTTFANTNLLDETEVKTETRSTVGHATYTEKVGIKGNVFAENGIYLQDVAAGIGWSNSIDHIFTNQASVGMVTINQMGMLTDSYALLSSDHLPQFVDITFNSNAPKI